VEGIGISPLIVATIISSISAGFTSAACKALFDASRQRSEVACESPTVLRSLMPVLPVIHSSVVSIFLEIEIVRTFSGVYDPCL
jgi:hypothetical protein